MKFWIFIFLIVLVISCKEKKNNLVNEEILREYQELKRTADDSRKTNIEQARVLNSTLAELAVISGNTLVLQQNFQKGNARMTQAEEIRGRIQTIKSRLERLEHENTNQELKETIRHLKIVIAGQENEITKLKKHIREKEKEIKEKAQEIWKKDDKIEKQTIEIRKKILNYKI